MDQALFNGWKKRLDPLLYQLMIWKALKNLRKTQLWLSESSRIKKVMLLKSLSKLLEPLKITKLSSLQMMKSKKEFKPEMDGLLCSKTLIIQELDMKEKLKPQILKPGLMNRVFHQFGNFQAPMPKRFLPQKPKFTFCTSSKEEKTFQRISNH